MIIDLAPNKQLSQELSQVLMQDVVTEARIEQVNRDSVVVADMASQLNDEQKRIIRAGMEQEGTLVLKNCKSEDMTEFAPFGVNAETAVIKSSDGGRRQEIVVVGEQAGPAPSVPEDSESTGAAKELALQLEKSLAQGRAFSRGVPEQEQSKVDASEISEQAIAPSKSQSDAQFIANLVDGLNFRSHALMAQSAVSGLSNINASQASGRVIFVQKNWNPKNLGGSATIFGSFSIELAAVEKPFKSKYVKITSTGTGVGASPKYNGEQNRGHFTHHARIIGYPGNQYTFDTNSVELPRGWRRIAIAPETPNATSTYTKTTGWSIGGSVSGSVSQDPSVTASLEASYSQSESSTDVITDFRVRNYSSAAACNWVYEYSKFTDNKWSLFYQDFMKEARVESLAGLSTSTMFLRNEAVYEAPANAQGWQRFIFYIGAATARLWEIGNWAEYKHRSEGDADGIWNYIDVNMSMVRHP